MTKKLLSIFTLSFLSIASIYAQSTVNENVCMTNYVNDKQLEECAYQQLTLLQQELDTKREVLRNNLANPEAQESLELFIQSADGYRQAHCQFEQMQLGAGTLAPAMAALCHVDDTKQQITIIDAYIQAQ